jgi:hypothetical protein
MMKPILIAAALWLALSAASDPALARSGHGDGGHWRAGGQWHGAGQWHGGGWNGGPRWHGGGWGWGWNGGWGWGPGIGLGLGYGGWGFGATSVCEPVFRPVRVRTSRGWRWRDVYVGDRCYWVDRW